MRCAPRGARLVQLQEGALDRVLRAVRVQRREDLVDGARDHARRLRQVEAVRAVARAALAPRRAA